jgi:hypothetical protein
VLNIRVFGDIQLEVKEEPPQIQVFGDVQVEMKMSLNPGVRHVKHPPDAENV